MYFFDMLLEAQLGDKDAQTALFFEFERLIRKTSAYTYLDKEECFQVLSLAFLTAIPKFDPDVVLQEYIQNKDRGDEF